MDCFRSADSSACHENGLIGFLVGSVAWRSFMVEAMKLRQRGTHIASHVYSCDTRPLRSLGFFSGCWVRLPCANGDFLQDCVDTDGSCAYVFSFGWSQ